MMTPRNIGLVVLALSLAAPSSAVAQTYKMQFDTFPIDYAIAGIPIAAVFGFYWVGREDRPSVPYRLAVTFALAIAGVGLGLFKAKIVAVGFGLFSVVAALCLGSGRRGAPHR